MPVSWWSVPILFGISFAGLAWTVSRALQSGAEQYAGEYSRDTAREFEDIFLFIPPRRITEIGWAAASAVFLLVFFATGSLTSWTGFFTGAMLGTLAGAFALHLPRWLLLFLKKRRLHKFNLQLVDTLVSMSNALKAGFSIMQAFEVIVRDGENPIAQEFDVLLQQTRVGVNFSEALRNMERRVGSQDLTLVVNAIEVARKTGGNLTEIFEKIAVTIRERMRIENRIRTLTAQGRLQGIVVGAMPIVIGCALMVVRPEMMKAFLHSAIGVGVITTVVILEILGALVIRKIINIDV